VSRVAVASPSALGRGILAVSYVVATYSDRLSEYVGGGVAARVIGSRLDPDGTIVFSEFNRGSGPSTAGAI
jgi:hypothetical protein